MKFKTILIYLLTTFFYSIFAQNQVIQVKENHNIFGKNTKNQSVILGTEYIFPHIIYNAHFQENKTNLFLELRPTTKNEKKFKINGLIVKYNLKDKKISWSKNVPFNFNQIQYGDDEVMLKDIRFNSSTYLEPETGNELWKKTMLFQYFSSEKKVGIAYKHNLILGQNKDLQGINLENGNILWERNLTPRKNWENVFQENDSILIVQNSGLHSLNINTGKGWDYEATVEKKRPLAVFSYSNLQSNLIKDSLFYYYASLDALVKINLQTGAIEWKQDLPVDKTSSSSINLNDNRIIFLNLGIATVGYQTEKYGNPFFAAYDIKSGETLFFNPLTTIKNPILYYKIIQDNLFLLFNDRIQKYDLKTGELLLEQAFDTVENGTLKYFINKIAGTVNHDLELNFFNNTPNQLYLFTDKAKTLVLNMNMDLINEIPVDDIYFILPDQEGEFKVLTNKGKFYIKDKNNKIVAELNNVNKCYIINNTLYSIDNNKLAIIDLAQLILN